MLFIKCPWESKERQHGASLTPNPNFLLPAGPARLSISANGKCCSVVWPESREYAIYAQRSSEAWERVATGSGTAVAWAGTTQTFAVLNIPKVQSGLYSCIPRSHSQATVQACS